MTPPTQQQIDRLPAWAREYLRTMLNKQRRAEEALKKFCDATNASRIYQADLYTGMKYFFSGDRIYFVTDAGAFEVQVTPERLEVRGIADCIQVHPRAANSVHIKLNPR